MVSCPSRELPTDQLKLSMQPRFTEAGDTLVPRLPLKLDNDSAAGDGVRQLADGCQAHGAPCREPTWLVVIANVPDDGGGSARVAGVQQSPQLVVLVQSGIVDLIQKHRRRMCLDHAE